MRLDLTQERVFVRLLVNSDDNEMNHLVKLCASVCRSPTTKGPQGSPRRAAQNPRAPGEGLPRDCHPEKTGPREHCQAGGGKNVSVICLQV